MSDSILNFNKENKNTDKQKAEEIRIRQEEERIEKENEAKAREIASSFKINGLNQEQNLAIYNNFLEKCLTMNNYDFYENLKVYSGYLTEEQRMHIIETYVKRDGEIQVKYQDVNRKAREKMAEYYKVKLNNDETLFSKDNALKAAMAASESKKMESMVKAYLSAKEEAKKSAVTIKEGEGNSKYGDLMNYRSRRVILVSKNGETVEFNNKEENEKYLDYKRKVNEQYTIKDGNHSINSDPEYD